MNEKRFSILIPTWNNLKFLQGCVESLRRYSSPGHELLIHVNEGSDGTLNWVRHHDLIYTHSRDNVGICHAVNGLAQLATHEYLVYFNDDMICCPGWDLALADRISTLGHDDFQLSGTLIEPRLTRNSCVIVRDFGADLENFQEQALLEALPSLARADWSGATWPPTLVHRKWWELVGGYSPEFSPGMSSDNDFSMKMWHAGCRVFLGVGDSLVYHFMSRSTGKVVKNNGRHQFLRKWGMTQSTFDRHYLRRGQPGSGECLAEPFHSFRWYWDLWRARIQNQFIS